MLKGRAKYFPKVHEELSENNQGSIKGRKRKLKVVINHENAHDTSWSRVGVNYLVIVIEYSFIVVVIEGYHYISNSDCDRV